MGSKEPIQPGQPAMTETDRPDEDGPPVCPVCLDVRGIRVRMELRRPDGADFGFFECPTCHLSFGDRRRAPREKPQS
jgi:hypothetical protein